MKENSYCMERKIDIKKDLTLEGFVKSSNSRRAKIVIMKSTYRTLNDCEMQHNEEVGLFTKPSYLFHKFKERPLVGRQEDGNDEKI